MVRILSALVLSTVIAACTPSQDVAVTPVSSGGAGTVVVDSNGLNPSQADRVRSVLLNAGYSADSGIISGASTAKVVFSIGEPVVKRSIVEVPKYEQVQELRFINGRQRVFTEDRFVGYERVHLVDTVYAATARLQVRSGDRTRLIRKVSTEGDCGNPDVLKAALIDVLLDGGSKAETEITLDGC